ncbi:hypothetical protein CFOL_v3_10899 [Cephalotus follicularis]|uniref:Uncharacterized protein n=1 Tax=Cephalotus follicularis TaxID=3775 RepID=A0A1Q3BHZ9_CEPFO|nr:hypothetical protein CFOL_v3_10899 [Cephalotus follicularis]
MIELTMMAGRLPARKTVMTNFVVVDVPSPYNAVLGCSCHSLFGSEIPHRPRRGSNQRGSSGNKAVLFLQSKLHSREKRQVKPSLSEEIKATRPETIDELIPITVSGK